MKCKLIQAENAGIDTKYLRRLTWIPQIDKFAVCWFRTVHK